MQLGNVLVFGGTGMLAEATGWVANHATHTIAFGRDPHKLARLAKNYRIETKNLDYTDMDALRENVINAYKEHKAIHMVVAWIHRTSPQAVFVIKDTLNQLQPHQQWTLLLIKGSSSRLSDIKETQEESLPNCTIKEVRLGFKIEAQGSRWLTHGEISDGVIQAIRGNDKETIVGTLEPWHKRP
ncbi:short-chain dehydrogenase [Oceanobacillus kapialis]|uniref:Short-chain dehydrogenase n=1 Tax=Oceanobacillus kapialis TaxID=481353 RepID=A0ABW5Q4J6_9BACI